MSSFDEYRLLRASGLFDPAFYLARYPDVAAANLDPLTHYIDYGAARLYQPSAGFDVAHYLDQCARMGEKPPNPLAHFLKVGRTRGLTAINGAAAQQARQSAFQVRLDQAQLTADRLILAGQIVSGDIAALEVLLDAQKIGAAQLQAGPDGIGFAFAQAIGPVAAGGHKLTLRARLKNLRVEEVGTTLETVEASPSVTANWRIFIDTPKLIGNAAATPIRGSLAINGWALAASGVEGIGVIVDGREEGKAQYGTRRDDVAAEYPAWAEASRSGFNAFVPYSKLSKGPHRIEIRLRGRSGEQGSVTFTVQIDDVAGEPGPWQLRRRMTDGEAGFHLRRFARLGIEPRFLIIVLDRDGDAAPLHRTLKGIRKQVYERWDAVIASAAPPEPAAASEAMAQLPAGRCRWLDLDHGAPQPWSQDERQLPYVMILEAGDEPGCDALLEFARSLAADPSADFIYGDDRRVNPATTQVEAFFKPDWSPDLILSRDYIGRAWCASGALLRDVQVNLGTLLEYGVYDAILRGTEQARAIRHIAAVLVENASETGEDPRAWPAIRRTLRRRGIEAKALPGRITNSFRIARGANPSDVVSIIIPTCGAGRLVETCIRTIKDVTRRKNVEIICIENLPPEETALRSWLNDNADVRIAAEGPFNWSRFNNIAAGQATGDFLLFLNDDTEIVEPDWLDVLLAQAARREVGAVGPMLLYPDQTIQHAGIFLAARGQGRHAFRRAGKSEPGYFGLAQTQRNVIGVTGACLLTRRDVFEAEGGFDESQSIINNDLDYCLRLWQRGLLTIYEPHATLIHHELASRGELDEDYDAVIFDGRWSALFDQGDPYFSVRLSKDHDDFSAEVEPVETRVFARPLIAKDRVQKILAVKLDHLGDCLTALPAIRRLKALFPQAELSILAGPWADAVWALEPSIGRIVHFEYFEQRSAEGQKTLGDDDLTRLKTLLDREEFDIAIDLRKVPDAREVLKYTGAAWLAGFDSAGQFPWLDVALEWEGDRALVAKHQHVSEDLIRLVDAVGIACEPAAPLIEGPPAKSEPVAVLAEAEAAGLYGRPVVAIHPFVGNPMRLWPAEHFARLIDGLAAHYGANIAILGSEHDLAAAEELFTLSSAGEAIFSFVGALDFGELPQLLTRSTLFIGNDSGPKHLAAGLGVPVIDIRAGVVDSLEWAPTNADGAAIRRAMSCSPCYIEQPVNCPRKLACLTGLTSADVLRLCGEFLEKALPQRDVA